MLCNSPGCKSRIIRSYNEKLLERRASKHKRGLLACMLFIAYMIKVRRPGKTHSKAFPFPIKTELPDDSRLRIGHAFSTQTTVSFGRERICVGG